MIPMHNRPRHSMMTAFDTPFFREFFAEPGKLSMRVDVIRQEDAYQLKADLPGVSRENLQLKVEDGILTIAAEMNQEKKETQEGYVLSERRSGRMERSFRLEDIDENAITADYVDGVLTVTLPRIKAEDKPGLRMIDIR
jgi:HSP20 family protein